MLKQRLITAIILLPIVLGFIIYASPVTFLFITGAVFIYGAGEWAYIAKIDNLLLCLIYLFTMVILCYVSIFIPAPLIFIAAFLWWIFATLAVLFYPGSVNWWRKNKLVTAIMGYFVLIPCWVALNFIRNINLANLNQGLYTLFFLFLLIWGADTAAYFVGKKWGKTKILPLVSPGKSLQGLIGAFLSTILFAVIVSLILELKLNQTMYVIILSLLTVFFSVFGDLFESLMKREANLKDSGKILPGHGGLLDRIDSLTAAAPVYALGIWILAGPFLIR